jgi:prefoldin subunit 5
MKTEFNLFKRDIDSWIKDFNGKLNLVGSVSTIVEENTNNIDHNYELLQELITEVRSMKEELNSMKNIQLMHLSDELQMKNKLIEK